MEETDSTRQLPPLQSSPTLKDITNVSLTSHEPLTEFDRFNDLDESPFSEIEEPWGINLRNSTELYALAGRGSSFSSTRGQGPRKQPVTIAKEFLTAMGYRR